MKKIFHLGTCSTCQRIIKELDLESKGFEFQDIKVEAITEKQLDGMKEMAGSYEALFSRRAMKFRIWGLNEMELKEADFRKYILEEYTFLKRPVIIADDVISVGSAKKEISNISQLLGV
jgi:arsenate reductase